MVKLDHQQKVRLNT